MQIKRNKQSYKNVSNHKHVMIKSAYYARHFYGGWTMATTEFPSSDYCIGNSAFNGTRVRFFEKQVTRRKIRAVPRCLAFAARTHDAPCRIARVARCAAAFSSLREHRRTHGDVCTYKDRTAT